MCYNIINRFKIRDDIVRRKKLKLPETADIEIPIIIPLVVYHNKDNWNVKMTLGEMIPNFDSLPDNIKKYIPNFEYMLSDLSNEEGGELVMTAAERLIEEGIEKGIELGKLKKAKESAITGIIKGYSTNVIMDITGLTENEIEEVRNEMLNKK